MDRVTRYLAAALVGVALLLSACTQPEGAINIYTRNATVDLGFRIDSANSQSWGRIETGSSGCSAVTVPWTISIGAAGRDGAVGDYHLLLSSADVADPTDAEIWIDVAEDGSLSWGEGRPAWDVMGRHECG